MFVVVTRVLKSEEVLRNISRDVRNCQEIFWREGTPIRHSRSHVMFGVEYDQCLCGGVPAVWPHSPRWPTDAVAHSRILTNIDNDEVRSMLSVSSFLLENYKSQRLMDVAWVHFNHLRDKYRGRWHPPHDTGMGRVDVCADGMGR